jgi:chromosomal replication initiator protein
VTEADGESREEQSTGEIRYPQWEAVQEKLRQTYGDTIFRSWLKPLYVLGIREGEVQIAAPTRFMRDWIRNHYLETLTQLLLREDPSLKSVELLARTREGQPTSNGVVTPVAEAATAAVVEATEQDHASVSLLERIGAPLDPRFTFENFVVGKPNELACAAARRVAESDSVVHGCNPLFLYGGVGLGKTHLMHAIAWHIRRTNPSRKVMYLSAEKFMYQFIRALRFNDAIAFKEQFRSVDVLMIDDVQFISGKDSTQEEFFHTFNALIDQNKQLVISGDRSPSDLDGVEERIRSRLGWGLVADIHTTNYELRLGILHTKVEKMGCFVPPKVLEFLAHKITSNIRELEGALNRVVAHATLVGREITLETTQDVLRDLLRANDRRVSVEDIQRAVAGHYNVKVSDMHSARRSVAIARPRQIAMYLSKQLTARSLPEIGRKFGGKDHTTVIHAIRRVEDLCTKDSELREDVEMLSRMLQNQ